MQCIGRGIRKQPIGVEQFADCIHSLSTPANNAPLASGRSTLSAFRFAGLVDQRRVKAPNTGGDDRAIGRAGLDDSPSARSYTEVNAENAFPLFHGDAPTQYTTRR